MKGICKDSKFKFWASFKSLPTAGGLFILFFFFAFSFFSAQDSLSVKISPETQITVIGKAQIYSTDQSFNKSIADHKVEVIAYINYNSDNHTVLITSDKKNKSLSEEVKITKEKVNATSDKSLVTKQETTKKTDNRISFKNSVSDQFFYAANAQRVNFIIPDAQNLAQDHHLGQTLEITRGFIIIFQDNNYHLSTRSKTFGYSKTYSLRPPPVLI